MRPVNFMPPGCRHDILGFVDRSQMRVLSIMGNVITSYGSRSANLEPF